MPLAPGDLKRKEMVVNKKTIMLGIVGDSAAGKTTLTRGIVNLLGKENVTAICSDDYHKYNRKQRKEMGITALNPACNYIDIMEQHFVLLREGKPILKPVYNHATGDFDPPEYIKPARFVIVEGLLGFHSRIMRDCFDVKVFLAPEESLRIEWKIKRDTTKRGYTREQVLQALEARKHDSASYIHPQRAYADIVVNFYPPPEHRKNDNSHLNVRLVLRPTIPHPDLSDVLEHAASNGTPKPPITMSLGRDEGKPADILEVDGNITAQKTDELEKLLGSHLMSAASKMNLEKLGVYMDGDVEKRSYPLALTQMLVAYHLVTALETIGISQEG